MSYFTFVSFRSESFSVHISELIAAFAFFACIVATTSLQAQTTAFTYQGSLTDAGSPARGSFQMQFKLYDALSGGTQVGSTIADVPVTASQGVFAAQLDFGSNALSGANRWLEIAVRHNSGESYSTILPRTQLTSSPYAVRTLSAASADLALDSNKLGGVSASGYLQTNGNGAGLTNLNASNVTTGTLSNARLAQIPTANIADAAVTTAKIATGQVVKGVTVGATTLTDNVTLAGSGNITVTPTGNTLTIASTSGGVGGSGTAGFVPLWSNPTTLGTSAITQNGNGVQLPNGVQLAPGAQNNNVAFGSPNGETGMTISGPVGRADVRFDGSTLKLVAGPAGFVPPPTSGIAINTAGNVGIGTASPLLQSGATGRLLSISDSNNPGIALTNTIGRQFFMYSGGDSGSFRIFDATSGADRLTLDNTGNAGIGTTTPAHRLSLIGGPSWTSNLFTGALELGNASAIGWQRNAAGNRFGIGQTTGGLTFFATLSDPGTTASPANYVMVINDNGNITQPINNNGLVKAMIYVNGNSQIIRCYNGITGATTGNCGFTVTRDSITANHTNYRINFGFQVDNRFLSVTPHGGANLGATFYFGSEFGFSANDVLVDTFLTDVTRVNSRADDNFMIIIY